MAQISLTGRVCLQEKWLRWKWMPKGTSGAVICQGDASLKRRAVVFIDGGYLNNILKYDFHGQRIDYHIFSDLLVGEEERLRTYYYNCMPFVPDSPTPEQRNEYQKMERFIYTIQNLPRFDVRLGVLQKQGDELVQKMVDVMIAVDLVRLTFGGKMDTAILLTGDSDFIPAIEVAKDAGVLVRLMYSDSPWRMMSSRLKDAVDDYQMLTDDIISRCLKERGREGQNSEPIPSDESGP